MRARFEEFGECGEVELKMFGHVKSGAYSKYNPEPPKLLSLKAIDVIKTVISSVLPMIHWLSS